MLAAADDDGGFEVEVALLGVKKLLQDPAQRSQDSLFGNFESWEESSDHVSLYVSCGSESESEKDGSEACWFKQPPAKKEEVKIEEVKKSKRKLALFTHDIVAKAAPKARRKCQQETKRLR